MEDRLNRDISSGVHLKRTWNPWQGLGDPSRKKTQGKAKAVAVFAQFGVKVGPDVNVAPKGVVNWTGEYSTKSQTARLKTLGQKNQV